MLRRAFDGKEKVLVKKILVSEREQTPVIDVLPGVTRIGRRDLEARQLTEIENLSAADELRFLIDDYGVVGIGLHAVGAELAVIRLGEDVDGTSVVSGQHLAVAPENELVDVVVVVNRVRRIGVKVGGKDILGGLRSVPFGLRFSP